MSDKWDYYPCTMGEDVASIFVDLGIRDEIKNAPAFLVRLQLHYNKLHENGLPVAESAMSCQRAADTKLRFPSEMTLSTRHIGMNYIPPRMTGRSSKTCVSLSNWKGMVMMDHRLVSSITGVISLTKFRLRPLSHGQPTKDSL